MHLELAYIDPGSGSLIIQAVIATVIAVPFFFRQQIARIMRTVRRRNEPATDVPPSDSTR
jgi:hypothetical protein